jgi:hypothetical protein
MMARVPCPFIGAKDAIVHVEIRRVGRSGRSVGHHAQRPVSAGEVIRLAVAVRAQELQVLEPVVVLVAVDVVQREAQRNTRPAVETTRLAVGALEPGLEKARPVSP